MPQLFDQFSGICATLVAVLPPLGEALRKVMAAWPQRPTLDTLFGSAGLAAIAGDPLLLRMLQAVPVRDIAMERLLTALRAALLDAAAEGRAASDNELAFCCALAKQCFINEYVFDTTPAEDAQVERLTSRQLPPPRSRLSYWRPSRCIGRCMPCPTRRLCSTANGRRRSTTYSSQQLREPLQERALRADDSASDADRRMTCRSGCASNTKKIPIRAGSMSPDRSRPWRSSNICARASRMPPSRRSAMARRSTCWSPAAAPAITPSEPRRNIATHRCSRSISA